MQCDELEMTERERRDFDEMVIRFIVMSMLMSKTNFFELVCKYVGKGYADPFLEPTIETFCSVWGKLPRRYILCKKG